ncbi:hypothetical protein HYDPIDRAFT_31697 [Hydnomerulius pinastri MD-312]|uniref:Uncharacterized protein n=1 Tax=Hydnomerulius pinastri MD-312 TaxID=994086 RepID=A0A0C9V5X4_9AGAM|nr:hypothetical protein HYDPIDRAFT_31697 [Hydnomerulius pinastri MD-312]
MANIIGVQELAQRPVPRDIPEELRTGEEGDEKSIYSQESADPGLHSFLISIPIVPDIKLERKATVKAPGPEPLVDLDALLQKLSLLSLHVRRSRDVHSPPHHYRRADLETYASALVNVDVSELAYTQGLLKAGPHDQRMLVEHSTLRAPNAPVAGALVLR